MTDPPIFRSTYQAVQMAYLIGAAPASPKSALRVLREMMADGYIEESVPISGIDFGDLTPLEQRGECANIVMLVERHLEGVELAVIQAKFGKELQAVKDMVRHIRPMLPPRSQGAAVRIVASLYCLQADKDKLTSYAISRKHGASQTTVHKAIVIATNISWRIEGRAMAKLRPIFIYGGIAGE